MAKLSEREVNALPASAFVFPATREVPIPDRPQAYEALRIAARESSDRAAVIQAEVIKRFGIGRSGASVQGG